MLIVQKIGLSLTAVADKFLAGSHRQPVSFRRPGYASDATDSDVMISLLAALSNRCRPELDFQS